MTRTSFLPGLVLLLLSALASAAPYPVLVTEDLRSAGLGHHLEYLEDPSGRLTIESLPRAGEAWHPSEQDVLNFGYTDAVYWVRFSLEKSDPGSREYLLEVAYPVLDDLRAFYYQEGRLVEQYELGDRLTFGQRPIDHPHFLLPVTLSPNQTTEVYLRVETSSSVQIPLALWDKDALLEFDYATATANAVFYGAMLVMALYNLLIFLSVRDVSYLYYVMYVLSMTLLVAGIQGDSFRFLWPDTHGWNDISLVIALSCMVFSPAFFTRSFLAIPGSRPLLSKFLVGLGVVSGVTLVSAFFLPYRIAMVITMSLAILAILSNFTSGILRWLDGYHAAKYYNMAWTFMLTGGLILALNKLGVIPRNWFTENAGQLGAGTEIVLLSFALANRMSHERRLREEAQKESAEAQQRLLDHQIRANEDLDRTVRERTEELERINAKLEKMSSTDGLTNLQNRRHFDDLFQKEYRRAYRDKYAIAVLMIDLDHFKQVNDNHGHQFGDLCLIRVAEVVQQAIRRPPDVAARYGGEEFVVLLPNTDLDGALCVARNIEAGLAATEISDGTTRLRMTASIGVASLIPEEREGWEQLLRIADECLYAAKHRGRNRVEWRLPAKSGVEVAE